MKPQLNIQALGADRTADVVHGVLVVWTAPDPRRPGRTVVGWYKNASVYRHLQIPTGSLKKSRTFKRQVCSYRVAAAESDCDLLPPEKRQFTIPPKKRDQKGVPGRFGAFYPATHKPDGVKIEKQIRDFIAACEDGKVPGTKKRGNKKPDILRRQAVEIAAIDFVWNYFETALGYSMDDRQEDDLGYDLAATLGEETLCIEVKGRSGSEITADFSANEYRAILSAEKGKFEDGQYRICIVSDALGTPTLHHFIFWPGVEGEKSEWRSIDGRFPLKFKEVTAARVSLDK